MTKNTRKKRFAICVSNANCDDLEIWKLYRVLPDRSAAREQFLRIIDESGEDYLYPESRFVVVDLPRTVVQQLLRRTASVGA